MESAVTVTSVLEAAEPADAPERMRDTRRRPAGEQSRAGEGFLLGWDTRGHL